MNMIHRAPPLVMIVFYLFVLVLPVAAHGADETAPLTCSSEPGERKFCPADTSAGVALGLQTSTRACLLGRTWGYESGGVWVSDGCSGEFILGVVPSADSAAGGFVGRAEAYGRFLGHVAFYDEEAEIQDNASWIGFRFSAGDSPRFFVHTEWAVNLLQNDRLFNPGAATNTEFNLETEKIDEFALRLGYLGADLDRIGTVTLGKQWGVHYDIAGYTADRYNVFGGGIGSIAYPAASDGGETGTGRADQALIYRNTILGIVHVGLQTQFRNTTNDEFLDGAGGSLRVTVLPGLELGTAYTRTFFSQKFKDSIRGISDDAEYIAFGARYEGNGFELGAVYATQNNGDLTDVLDTNLSEPDVLPVGFDATGIELYGKVNIRDFSFLAGFVNYDSDTDDDLIDPDFRTRYYVIGGEYHTTENSYVYAEYRLDDSVTADGSDGDNVMAIGFRYNFSWKGSHRF